MKETLEKLWTEYLLDECAAIDTDEERILAKKSLELHEKANAMLDKNQQSAVEEYLDTLYEMEALFVKKAFCRGCEFTASFLFEARNSDQ